jgi:hypothetical protein
VRHNDGVRSSVPLRQILIFVAAVVVASALASLFGAVNMGTALTFGQIAFAVALVAVLVRGR